MNYMRGCVGPRKGKQVLLIVLVLAGTLIVLHNVKNVHQSRRTEMYVDHPQRVIHSSQASIPNATERGKKLHVTPAETPHPTDSVSGFKMTKYLKSACDELKPKGPDEKTKTGLYKKMRAIPSKEFLYCPVEKVGSTFWWRVMYLLERPSEGYIHPFEVPIPSVLTLKRVGYNPNVNHDDWFQFMFVREPYTRLLSVYIDKVFVPNPVFWKKFGKPSIRMFRDNATGTNLTCGQDASFSEFVQFVVWSVSTKKQEDYHFTTASEMCIPCEMNYTFIGKMENAAEDFPFVLKQFGLASAVHSMGDEFQNLTAEDAIIDSITAPYGWRKNIEKCMNWNEALMRVWRKLQIRGLVGINQKYPLDETSAQKIKRPDFIELAKQARRMSKPSDLKEQKKFIVKEIFRNVPIHILEKFRDLFHLDFKLFGYNDSPDVIFKRDLSVRSSRDYLNFRV